METGFSVLISIHKSLSPVYFQEAMQSVLDQSRPADEIILVEDGKLGRPLLEIIDLFKTKLNIVSLKLAKNLGLASALNLGLEKCSYDLIIRVDGDDICLPDRFEKQLNYMKDNPRIAAASCHVSEFNHDMTIKLGSRQVPITNKDILKYARRRSPLNHPATIFRKSFVEKVNGYPNIRNGQDYALWSLLLVKGYILGNQDLELVKMRTGSELLRKRGYEFFKKEIELLRFQRRINFISNFEMISGLFLRGFIRMQIPMIRSLFYKIIRKLDS
jgi:amylovoran biosynthesis glycosyltransferase AmsE